MRSVLAAVLLVVSLGPRPAPAAPPQGGAGRAVTPEDIVALRRPSDPRLAPAGDRIAFVVRAYDAERDAFDDDLYLVEAPEGRALRLTYHPKRDWHPRWSPDGTALAFLSDRDGKADIYLFRLPGGEPERLTRHGAAIASFFWSPDGRAIYFIAPDPDEKEEASGDEPKVADVVVVDEDLDYARLWRFDLEAREAARLTGGTLHVVDADVSADGARILFVGQATPKIADLLTRELYLLDAAGGEPRRLTDNAYAESNPRIAPDGRWLSYLSEADGNPVAGPSRIHLLAPDGGAPPRVLAREFDGYIRDHRWTESGAILFFADIRVARHVYRVVPDEDAEPEPVSAGDGLWGPFDADARGEALALLHEDPATPPDVYWTDRRESAPRRLTELNPQTRQWALGRVETIRWRSRDGLEIEGLLVHPVDAEPGRPSPTILQVHGGPEGAYTRGFMASYGSLPHVYAARGYATFMPNFRGSSNYGAAFAQANKGDVGGGDYEDCMSGLDALVERGVADPERLAIKGWSYGGYMSAWAVGHTDRFRAAAWGAGLSNAVSYYGTADIQFSRENLHGGTPYSNREKWIERSPLTYVQNVTTPSLIFHGEKDERVPLGQSRELYTGLVKHGVTAKLVIYPDQPHGLRVPSSWLDKMKREIEWIDRYVRGVEPEPTAH